MMTSKTGNRLLSMTFFVLFVQSASSKATIKDCDKAEKRISFRGGSLIPDPIAYPGNVALSADFDVLEDLPESGLQIQLNINKLEPMVMPVPCLLNVGSCTYDACDMISRNPEQLCPMFPPGKECGCPLKTGYYSANNVSIELPDFGSIFATLLKGPYSGNLIFVEETSKAELACMQMTFDIEQAE